MVRWFSGESKLLVFLFVIFLAITAFSYYINQPLSSNKDIVIVTIPHGASANKTIKILQQEAVLNPAQRKAFSWLMKLKSAQKSLQAGEYAISRDTSLNLLLTKLISGDVMLHSIRFSEGGTIQQTLQALWQHPSVKKTLENKSEKEIVALLTNQYTDLEGLLFPDTYYFPAQTSDLVILKLAFSKMQKQINLIWQNCSHEIVLKTPYEALVLASIIEKETALDRERCLISGIFQQRILKHMRLQADPTVIYGLGQAFNGNLTRADLVQPTPYNTYVNEGLPPTPIALPSLKSLEAACHPDKTNFLYFVAKGDGSHHFSATLDEHNQAVALYQGQSS